MSKRSTKWRILPDGEQYDIRFLRDHITQQAGDIVHIMAVTEPCGGALLFGLDNGRHGFVFRDMEGEVFEKVRQSREENE
jgi:hypothetical protein